MTAFLSNSEGLDEGSSLSYIEIPIGNVSAHIIVCIFDATIYHNFVLGVNSAGLNSLCIEIGTKPFTTFSAR